MEAPVNNRDVGKKQNMKREYIKQAIICLVALTILALTINIGVPALNKKQVFDGLDFNTRLVDKTEPRSVDGGPRGHLTFGPGTMLMPGDYTLWLYYSTDTDTNYVDICTPDGVIYKATLLKGKTVHRIDFTYDKETSLDCRTLYSGEGHLSVEHMELRRSRKDLQMVQFALDILLLLIFAGYLGYFFAKVEWKKPNTAGQDTEMGMQIPWKTRIKKSVPVALFISFTFFVAGPIGLYLSNTSEFWFSLWQMLPALLLSFVCGTLLALGILSVFPKQWYKRMLVFAFGLGVAIYVEGNFLVQDYGLLNGNAIEWEAFSKWAVIDTLIWIVISGGMLLLAHFLRRWTEKLVQYGSLFLVAVQAVALVISIVPNTKELTGKSDYLLTTENLSTVSDKENIIVFMLDTFDASYMVDFLNANPDNKEKFTDFIFYPNASTYGAMTHVAVPHVLTNVILRGEVSSANYLKLAYQYTPLYQTLAEHNYDTGIYTLSWLIDCISSDKERQSYISNAYEGRPHISSQAEFLKDWIELTAFRYLPHVLKGNFTLSFNAFNQLKSGTDGHNSYNLNNTEPYIYLQEPLIFETGKNAFRFYHTNGTHAGSIIFNERAEEVGSTRTTLNMHIMGCFYVIDNYIQQLRDEGVYDNSTIIVMADHGGIAPYGNPLFMIKPKNHEGDFKVSNAPISYTDLLPTLLDILDEDGSQYGRSIFEIGEDEQRTRYFYRDMKCDDGVVRVMEYRTDGNAGDPDSWIQVGSALDQLPLEVEPVGAFEESSQIYTVLLSNEATRHYQLSERPEDDLQVDLTLYSLTDQASHMVAYADGVEVFNGSVDPSGNVSFVLPEGVLADDVVEFRFELPEETEKAAHLIALNFAAEQ